MKIQRLFSTLCITLLLLLAGCGGSPSDSGDDDNNPPDNDNDTEDTTPPSSPGNLEGTSGDQMVELAWDTNDEDDLEGYNLYRAEESFSDVSDRDPVNGDLLTGTDYSDEDVQNGTTYYYRLTAVDGAENESGTSTEVEITPFADPPDRPKIQVE